MSYGLQYILPLATRLNQFYEIYLSYLNYSGTTTILTSAVDSLTLRSTGGDENKFQPLLGTECLFNIKIDRNSPLSIDSFVATHDNDIMVSVYLNRDYSKVVYQGFVVVEDNSQPFVDPPFAISIRALDGLGLLKNVDMVDANGLLFAGIMSIEDWIGNILYKTGSTLNLRVYFPFAPIGASDAGSSLKQTYLDASTWQTGPITTTNDPSVDVFQSEAVDCYTALEAMVRCFRCRLFQEDGVWNLVSLYSYIDPNGMNYTESQGTLSGGLYTMNVIASGVNLNYDAPVGYNQVIHPVKEDAVRYLKLATKWVKLNYNYDQSANKICNQSLNQGQPNAAYDGTISSSIQDPNIVPVVTLITKGYDAFCYTHLDYLSSLNPYPSQAPAKKMYVRAVIDGLGYEMDRYLVLEQSTNNGTYARSSKFKIDVSDLLSLTFDWRSELSSTPIGQVKTAFAFLYGTDGSHWAMLYPGPSNLPVWLPCDSNFQNSGNTPAIHATNVTATNTWNNVSLPTDATVIATGKAPVSGDIEILFVLESDYGGTEYWFKNINISIIPYLQGTYVALKGDYNYSSSNNTIKQTDTEDVQISDSPKRYFKGALVDQNGSLYNAGWHRKGVLEDFRFTQLMERIIYNNVYRQMQKIEGTFRGVTYTNPSLEVHPSGYLNRYYFTNHPVPTKKFILTSFDNDLGEGYGRRVWVEILADQNDTGWAAPDIYVFNYLFNTNG